jgi:hypothetical protein
MADIVVSGNTSGSVTLRAPDVSGTTILTLPTTSGTLVVTGGAQTIEFADGTVSAPSITNSGDTNTGIYFPAADTIAFTEGGVESMRIDSSGNLLLATTNPIYSLTNRGNITIGGSVGSLLFLGTGATTGGFLNYTQATSAFEVWNGGNGPTVFATNNTERMRIGSNGNIGIGTTATDAAVNIYGTNGTASSSTTFWNLTYAGMVIRNSSDTANTVAGIAFQGGSGGGSNSAIANIAESTSLGALAFYTGGSGRSNTVPERMRIDSNGNVGIGTSSPQTCLDVVSGTNGANSWAWFHSNTGGATPNANINSGIMLGGNYSAGNSESNIMWGTGFNAATQYLSFSTWNNSTNTVTEQARITAAGLFYMNSGYGSSAPAYGCRAWVNFEGSGTPTIRASGNVSSITDNGTGDFTLNFTTAFPDANYSYACSGSVNDGTPNNLGMIVGGNREVAPTTTTLRIVSVYISAGSYVSIDAGIINVAVFR